jgi:arylsulfatase A
MKNYQLLVVFAFLLYSSASIRAQSPQPNVIIILADDIGYADAGVYGSPKIKTPVLDKLASQGMKFTGFYAENNAAHGLHY